MPRKPVSNEAWFTNKQDNCLEFVGSLCNKYETLLQDVISLDRVSDKVTALQKDETKRAMLFSAVARKQLVEGIPAFEGMVKAAKAFYTKSDEDKRIEYFNGVDTLVLFHRRLGEFIEYLEDNSKEVLPDVDKLAGYTSLFFGEFIKNT